MRIAFGRERCTARIRQHYRPRHQQLGAVALVAARLRAGDVYAFDMTSQRRSRTWSAASALSASSAAARAAAQVQAVRDDPAGRLALVTVTYRGPRRRAAAPAVPPGGPVFMRWQVHRGVLDPLTAEPPGSPWWRAVNERLLRDACEAVARSGGFGGDPSSPTIELGTTFIAQPTARNWYRAHNASIVAASWSTVTSPWRRTRSSGSS